MKPIAVFRHSPTVEPGYFASFLDQHSIPWQLIAIDERQAVPADARQFSGLCLLGGPMSVNDALPWLPPLENLVRQAVDHDIPVIGHCLGGQLISKALGGKVSRNPVKEIGWTPVRSEGTACARAWLGDVDSVDVYQWHSETFTLPPAAVRILSGKNCANQAFVLGPHLAMQFHIEMTEALIRTWTADWRHEFSQSETLPASVQSPAQQLAQMPAALARMRQIADRLYGRWIEQLT